MPLLGAILFLATSLAPAQNHPQPTFSEAQLRAMFIGNAHVSFDGDTMIVTSNGIPNHETGQFPNAENPNSIRVHNLRFVIPLHPTLSSKVTPTPFGPIGVAINGIPFYNQYNGEGRDAVKLETFDSCCGHPDPSGLYHYHKYPICVHNPFKDVPGKHSSLIGFMFDGFALYGPNGEDGRPPTDLDSCNGHWDPVRGYHYHATAAYPYLIGGYHGVVDLRRARGRMGPPGGRPFPGPPPFGR